MSDESRQTQGLYRFKFSLSADIDYRRSSFVANRVGWCTVQDLGYEPETWDALSEQDRQARLEKEISKWALGYVDYNWEGYKA